MPGQTACLTGALGEMAFERHFLAEGRFIAVPRFDLHKTDFVLEWEGQLVKVQVKTMSLQRKARLPTYTASIQTARDGKPCQPYQEGDCDFIAVVNLDYDRIWMLPLHVTKGKRCLAWVAPGHRKVKRRNTFEWEPYRIK